MTIFQHKPPPPPLEEITTPMVSTEVAAFYLNRTEQTLRTWACKGKGPLQPQRVNGRLGWPVAEIRKIVGAV